MMPKNPFRSLKPELRVALVYGAFAILWFLFSHRILLGIFGQNALERLDIFIDIAFALIGSTLIYTLMLQSRQTQDQMASRELEHLNEFQRFFAGTIEYAIFSLDACGLVRTWDAEAARMHGLTGNQILNKPVADCFVHQEAWHPEQLFKQAQLSGRAAHLGWLTRQDGFRYWGEVIFERIKLADGQITYLVVTRNLSGSRGNERFKSMIESMSEGLIVIDKDWRFVFINSNGAKLLERDTSNLIGKNIWQEFPAALDSDFGRACQQAMEQNISSIIADPSSTSARWLENRIYPSPDGILIFYSDVTEKRQVQEAIRISEQRLRMVLLAGQQHFFEIDLRVGTVTTDVDQVSGLAASVQKTSVRQSLEDWQNQIHPDDRAHVLEELDAFVSGDKAEYWVEYRWKMADDTWRWKLSQGAILEPDEVGRSARMLGTQIDIQSFKSIEQALKTSNQRYLKLMEASPVAVFETNSKGEIVYVNERWQEITGYSRLLAVNNDWSRNLLHPEDREGFNAAWGKTLTEQKLFSHEYRFQHDDGTVRWVYGLAEPLRDAEGTVTGYLGSIVDLTQSKQDSLKLEQSEKMFRLISENSSDMISLTNLQGVKQYVSPAVNQILGYSVEEFLTLSPSDWKLDHDPQRSRETQRRLLCGESTLETDRYRARRKDGAIIWLEVSARMVMNPITNQMDEIQTSTRDITNKIQAQQALEASEQLYRTITENSHDVTLIVDLDSVIQYVSPAVKTILGFDPAKIKQTQAISYIHSDDLEPYLADRQMAIKNGQDVFRSKARTRCNNGDYIWTESVVKIIRDTAGNVKELQITLRDINEQVIAQEKLQTSERLYRAITENSYDVTFITNFDAIILYVSPSIKALSGFEPEEMVRTPIMDYFHPEDLQQHLKSRREAFEKGLDVFRSESRLRRKDGRYIWVESILKIKRDQHGQVQELQVTSRDMTERVIAQEKLESSEQLYRTITENAHEVIMITAIDGKIRYVSPSATAIFGYNKIEIDRVLGVDFIHSEDLQAYLAVRQQAVDNQQEYFTTNFRVRHQNGHYIWVESTSKLIRDNKTGALIEIQATVRDIGERVVALKKLEESERLYRTITENAQDVIVISNADGKVQFLSPSAKSVLGYDDIEFDEFSNFATMHPEDKDEYLKIRRETIENHKEDFKSTYRVRQKNGNYVWIESRAKLIRDRDTGAIIELQSTLRDISERVVALKKLEESERLYRTITENAQDVIVVSTTDRKIRYVSPSASSVLGYSPDEIGTVLSLNATHPDDQASYTAIRQDAIEKHKSHFSATIRLRHQNGDYVWIETLSKLIYDPQTKELREIQSTMRDVTSRKIAQEALEKLNAELEERVQERTKRLFEVNLELESFTSSVSHDLRSPLNVIQGFGRAFLEDYSDTTPTAGQDFVNRIVGAAGRMDVLITDLLQYSRLSKAEIILTPIALAPLLLDLVHEFEIESQRYNATISLKGNFPVVLARETILRQILINLVGNSLKFSRSDVSPEITIWAEIEQTSKTVKIHVQDNGIGIETRDLERIFQPFERLHGVSEYPGSGIGLAFVKRGIERMGGQIVVTSSLGKGSHFWLSLNQPRETS